MNKKLLAMLITLVLLTSLLTATVTAGDSEPNGLSALEYRVNGGDWQSVPGFSAEEDEYALAFPRERVFREITVELRATATDPATRVEYNPENATYVLTKTAPNNNLAVFVLTPEQTDKWSGKMTLLNISVPTADPQVEEITAALKGASSGEKPFGGENKPAFSYDETVELSLSGLGLGAEYEPIMYDRRYRVTSVTLDDGVQNLWNDESGTASFSTKTLAAGEHKLTMNLALEMYVQAYDEDGNPTDPVTGEWFDMTEEMGKPVALTGSFTVSPQPEYTLTVINGTGGGTGVSGTVFKPVPNDAPEGQEFDHWEIAANSAGVLTGTLADGFTYTLGTGNATITATYRPIAPPPTEPPTDPPTEPPTEPPTAPPTDPPTEPPTTPPTDPPTDPDAPKTGDDASPTAWIILLAVSGAGALGLSVLLLIKSKKEKKET